MYAWELPTTVDINGRDVPIATDYRQILNILVLLKDPDLTVQERWLVALNLFYKEPLKSDEVDRAVEAMGEFIDTGVQSNKNAPTVMDWEQDAPIILPAVNRTLGYECRSVEYLHWWTFLGAYMEIGESLYSQVVSIRQKRAMGKKLEKHEKEFEHNNKKLITLKRKLTEEEQQQEDANRDELKALLGI